jgi:hypothetical protein
MDTCIVETGLLRKKPCGQTGVTKCANCEIPLCAQHAVAQLNAQQKKTGTFLCPECEAARKQFDKNQASASKAAAPKAGAAPTPGAAKPAPAAAKPASPAAAGKPAAPAAKAPEKKPDDDAPLEFTPTKK